MLKKNNSKKRPRANFTFNKKTAIKFSKTAYYQARVQNIKMYTHIQNEKRRLSTYKRNKVRQLIKKWVSSIETGPPAIMRALDNIKKRNISYALKLKHNKPESISPFRKHSNLIGIISHPTLLMLAYRNIRGNKGAMAKAGPLKPKMITRLNSQQKKQFKELKDAPDGISGKKLLFVLKLLRKGIYPWGI
jgi:hypothetical protein